MPTNRAAYKIKQCINRLSFSGTFLWLLSLSGFANVFRFFLKGIHNSLDLGDSPNHSVEYRDTSSAPRLLISSAMSVF